MKAAWGHLEAVIVFLPDSSHAREVPIYSITRSFLELGPGSSSQYSMYWLRQMPVYWPRIVHWSRLRGKPRAPPAVEGARGALLKVFVTRFGFTRAKTYVDFGPWFKGNLVVDRVGKVRESGRSVCMYGGIYRCAEELQVLHTTARRLDNGRAEKIIGCSTYTKQVSK